MYEIILLLKIKYMKISYNSLSKKEQGICSTLRYNDLIEDYVYNKSDFLLITWKGKKEILGYLYSALTFIIVAATLIITIIKK